MRKTLVALSVTLAVLVGAVLLCFPVSADNKDGGDPTSRSPVKVYDSTTKFPALNNALNASALIESEGCGSGVIFKNGDISFVWTDAHVVSNTRHVKTVIDPTTGLPKVQVNHDDVWVVQVENEDGRKVGETHYLAKVVKMSEEQDIALLVVYKKGFGTGTAVLADEEPTAGEACWHVGSMNGYKGYNSVSDATIAAVGRLRHEFRHNETQGIVYDELTGVVQKGSSGGGVWDKKSGKLCGLVTEFLGHTDDGFTYGAFCVTPARRLREFAKKNAVAYAIGDGKSPSLADVLALNPTAETLEVPDDFPGKARPPKEEKAQGLPVMPPPGVPVTPH
jgi:hypothetical protein